MTVMSAHLRAENETVLRRMADHGGDLTRARLVDFNAVFIDQASASAFAEKAEALGYMVKVEESGCVATHPWDVVATRQMVPSLTEVTNVEVGLGGMARELVETWTAGAACSRISGLKPSSHRKRAAP
jgi:hypothetical protein